jgi:hypothetical protein
MLYKCRHFGLAEIVCPHILKAHGEQAWQFFDPQLLMTIDLLRDQFGVPIYGNNYDMLNDHRTELGLPLFTQRGLRCVLCQLVQDAIVAKRCYMSAHITGQAFDGDVKGMTAVQVRQWILANQIKLPFPVTIEKGVNWLHIATRDGGQKVTLINPS